MPRLLLALGLLLAAPALGPSALGQPAPGRSADALYHDAAARYIAGDDAAAEALAERGLALDPAHPRLIALLEALRQEREPSAGAGASQAEGEPEPGDGAPPAEPGTSDSPGEGDDSAEGEPEGQDSDGPAGDPAPGRPASPSEGPPPEGLSPAEAERILRAIEADEQDLLRRVQRRPERPRTVERDW